MTAGLQVWNDGNPFQIDGSFPNMQLRSSAQAAAVMQNVFIGNNPGGTYTATLPIADFFFAAQQPVIGLYSPGAPALVKSTATDNAGNWHVQVLCATAGQVVTILCFDTAQNTGARSGFQIFDGNGVCTFDATAPPLVVTDYRAGNIAGVDPSAHVYNSTVTYPDNTIFPTTPGRKFAVVGAEAPMLDPGTGVVVNGQWNTYLQVLMFQTDDGQIQMPRCVFGETPSAGNAFAIAYGTAAIPHPAQTTAYGSCFNYRFLIADVTGIV